SDLFYGVNSTFWYFSWILFFYLIFPILFNRKYPLISALLILAVAFGFTNLDLPIKTDVLKLYKLHLWAFPFGIIFALLISEQHGQIFVDIKDLLIKKLHFFKPLKP